MGSGRLATALAGLIPRGPATTVPPDPQNPICPCRPEGLLEDPSSVTAKPVVVYSPLMRLF